MTDSATKICCRCGRDLPLSAFHRLASAPDGRQYTCKECRASHAAANRAKARERQQRYREANRDKLRAAGREYMQRPEIQERARGRYEANRDERTAQMRERYKGVATMLRAAVFGHYGAACACCGRTDDLCIDHVNGDGRAHREELFGRQEVTIGYYQWLVDHGFPAGFQTLCRPCNASKAAGERCRMRHR